VQELIHNYGYLAVFIGTFLEGEVILALAGLAAHQGLMSFPVVVAVAFVGGFAGDQFLFFLGRHYGDSILCRFPKLAANAPRVKALLRRWDAPLVIAIRFMYGMRIAGPIVIGSAGIAPWRLAVFNFIGALIWAPLIAAAGYGAGHAIEPLMEYVRRIEIVVLIVVACIFLALLFLYKRKR
jgi:membrane protein DedA with SNARE-associated domain